jgi:hypothetical protein
MTVVKRTQEELLAELHKRFGEDPMNWAFQCPACKDIATGQDFRDALAADPDRYKDKTASDYLGRVCIGRVSGALLKDVEYTGRGCDWASFGLFRGPEFVIAPDGTELPCFPLAPAPAPEQDPAEKPCAEHNRVRCLSCMLADGEDNVPEEPVQRDGTPCARHGRYGCWSCAKDQPVLHATRPEES